MTWELKADSLVNNETCVCKWIAWSDGLFRILSTQRVAVVEKPFQTWEIFHAFWENRMLEHRPVSVFPAPWLAERRTL